MSRTKKCALVNEAIVSLMDERIKNGAPWLKANREAIAALRHKPLLSTNLKVEKFAQWRDRPFSVKVLTLTPGKFSGVENCVDYLDCIATCLMMHAGRMAFSQQQLRACWRSLFIDALPAMAENQLHDEIAKHAKTSKQNGLWWACRLDGASDVSERWYRLMHHFYQNDNDGWFYDYTKDWAKMTSWLRGDAPINYYLTFSAGGSQTSDSHLKCLLRLKANVAMCVSENSLRRVRHRVFEYPKRVRLGDHWFDCFNADTHDVRLPMLDGSGRIGLLRVKGHRNAIKAAAEKVGFARSLAPADMEY